MLVASFPPDFSALSQAELAFFAEVASVSVLLFAFDWTCGESSLSERFGLWPHLTAFDHFIFSNPVDHI